MNRSGCVAILFSGLLLGGCDEIGNPLPGNGPTTGELVRTSDSPIGPLVTEVRLVDPSEANALIATIGSELDHLDRAIPSGGALAVVVVRPAAPMARPIDLHLVTDFVLPGSLVERRVWIGRGSQFVAIFAVRAVPIDVRTTTL